MNFEFQQGDNGWLMSGWACIRSMFLIFAFPRIISHGRKWHMARYPRSVNRPSPEETGAEEAAPIAQFPTQPEELEAPVGTLAEEEPVIPEPTSEDGGTGFDLFFLRWSLVLDGVLTTVAAFATQKWHIFLGTGAARNLNTILTSPSRISLALCLRDSSRGQGRYDADVCAVG